MVKESCSITVELSWLLWFTSIWIFMNYCSVYLSSNKSADDRYFSQAFLWHNLPWNEENVPLLYFSSVIVVDGDIVEYRYGIGADGTNRGSSHLRTWQMHGIADYQCLWQERMCNMHYLILFNFQKMLLGGRGRKFNKIEDMKVGRLPVNALTCRKGVLCCGFYCNTNGILWTKCFTIL